jgi:hypothetical protein
MTTETADWVGLTLDGRYAVTAKLGQGGMGFVYRARDARLNCDVVVKVPRASMLEEAGFRRRFQDEVRALVQLAHPHVVKVSDFGQHDGVPFAVMQFLAGGSLEDRRPKDERGRFKPIAPRSLAGWLPQTADALDYIHKRGYVHRDVKPANILFDGSKNPYISDFGVAKAVAANRTASPGVTGTGMVLGTPAYMAPELVMAEKFDGRIDQYALAVTVFELLAGRPPFDGATPMAVLVKRTTEEPPLLSDVLSGTSPTLSAAVGRGLSKDPAARFANCTAFAEAVVGAAETSRELERHLSSAPSAGAQIAHKTARDTPKSTITLPGPQVTPKKRAKAGMVGALAGGGVLFAGVVGLTVWLAVRGNQPAPTTEPVPGLPSIKAEIPAPERVEVAKPPHKGKTIPPKAKDKSSPAPPRLPITRVTSLRATPGTLKLLAGGSPQTLTLNLERTGDGPVTIALQAPSAVQIAPADPVTVNPGDPDPTFQLTVPEPAVKITGMLTATATAGNNLSRSFPIEVWRHDFGVSLAPHGPVELQAGQSATLPVQIDRRAGYRGRVTIVLDSRSSLEARPVTLLADQNEAAFVVTAHRGAPSVSVTATLKASAADVAIAHEVSFPARIYSLAKVRTLQDERPAAPVTALATEPRDSLVISGHADGSVRLWDTSSGTQKWEGKERHGGPVLCLAFASNGKHALSGGGDKLVFLWDVGNGECKRFEKYHATDVWHVGFDKLVPVSTSADRVIHWNAMTGEPRKPDQGKIAGTSGVHLWIDKGRPLQSDTHIVADGWDLSGWGGDALDVFQGPSLLARLPGNGGAIRAMAASGRSGRVLTLGGDGLLRLWDVQAKRLLPGFPLNPGGEVTAATLYAGGNGLLLGGPDGAITLWRFE